MTQYFCVLDFEATCWDGKRNDSIREIIEFPSILYSVDYKNNITKIDEFDQFVKPIINPLLSDFCIELTGITQNQVDTAKSFLEVYNNHYNWLLSHLGDSINKVIIITCGRWDMAEMLPIEIKRYANNIIYHNCYKKYANIKDSFNSFYNKNAGGMMNMLTKLKIEHTGTHHSGIDDCRNISKIIIKMIEDGFKLKQLIIKRI